MERRQNTTAGVLFWTPAPVRTSPRSTAILEDDWDDDDDEEQAEREDDFVSQMDENGIIGLAEALEDVELEECNSDGYPGSFTPEEAHPSGCETDGPSEELSYKLSERVSHTKSAGEDVGKLSSYKLKIRSEDEEERQRMEELAAEHLTERDKRLNMIKEEKDGEEERGQSHRSERFEHTSTSGQLGATVWLAKGHVSKEENKKVSSGQSSSVRLCAVDPVGVSSPVSQSALPVAITTLPHLLHFTAKELNTAPGIEAETFPEMSFTDFPESCSSHISLNSSPRCSEIKLRASPPPIAVFSEQVISKIGRLSNDSGKEPGKTDEEHSQPTPKPRRTRKHSPEATYPRTHSPSTVRFDSSKSKQNKSCDREPRTPRTRSNVGMDESGKGSLSCHTPDFSKVEPRVRFPKGGYKPPKSTLLLTRKSLSPEPPVVFKSPADIVKDVLLNTPDGSPTPSECDRQPTSGTNAIVPQEFRCRQQATTLLHQLQEDYNRLLTKYAEAENTIDRLRLEAKVNLYSDPPNPGHSVQSGLNCDASKFLKLDFPRAQKADIRTDQGSSASGPTEPGAQLGQQLANILFSQTDKFLQQMQTFEDLLKSKKLKPFEQTEGTSQLAEGLESLERGYLLARDEHKLLQQRGAEISQFDPERELEGLIFQCGLRMDELKEQVEQMQWDRPTCGTPPSPPPQPTSPSAPFVDVETLTHPQAVPVPLLADPVEAAEADVSSVCKNDEVESEEDDEETLYLSPLTGKTKCTGEDFSMAANHYQSIKELPKPLDHSKKERVLLSAALRTNMQPEDKDRQETGNNEVWKTLPQRNTKSDHQASPSDMNKQQNSRSSPPASSSRIMILPVFPHTSSRRVELGKSHSSSQSSLGDIKGSERSSSKVQAASRRVFSQDGIISPETDSGFVGSESSRLTPAAASSPLHQRASESSVSVSQEGNKRSPQTGLVSAPSHFSSPSHSHTAKGPSRGSQLSLDRPPRNRRALRRPTFSCSPQRWVGLREQRVDSGSSEFGLESDSTHTGSEGEKSDQYTESINSLHSSHSSSTSTQYHQDDSPRAGSSSQNCNEAVQTLQAEVTRLKERLEVCLRNKKPVSATRSAPPAQEKSSNHSTASPRIRPGEQQSDVGVDEVEEDPTLRRTARRKSASANQQKPQHDYLTRSEPQPFAPQPHASRCTLTSAAPDSCSSHTSHRKRTRHSVDSASNAVFDETSILLILCLKQEVNLTAEVVMLLFALGVCHLTENQLNDQLVAIESRAVPPPAAVAVLSVDAWKRTKSLSQTVADSQTLPHTPTPNQPSPLAEQRRADSLQLQRHLHCCSACQCALHHSCKLYSSPIYVSPNRTHTSSRVAGRGEVRRTTKRRSLSADRERSLDSSLNKAIRAARHMKHTSGHMARSLASGLQYQELLAQSCSY